MASANDVAAYLLQECGSMTAMKMQKLVYYSQAWSLVWDDAPLFTERIEAWANGPVVPTLYKQHRGKFTVSDWPSGNPDKLLDSWRDARAEIPDTERGNGEITLAAMVEYYGSLQ